MISPDPNTPPDIDSLKYVMLGHDSSTTQEKLAKYKGAVDWTYLRPHYQRQALLFVDPCLTLEEAGAAFSHDDAAKVAGWLKSGDLVQVADLHAAQWEREEGLQFEALVVSPFVLCRPARDGTCP